MSPLEKMERRSLRELSDAELLALVLRSKDAADISSRISEAFPKGLGGADYAGLGGVAGLGKSGAATLAAALELSRRWLKGSEARPLLDSPARVLEQIPYSVRESRKEHLLAFYLNARSRLVYAETVSVGTLSASLVHPREVFSPAIARSAAALIVAHNHPSGDALPSDEDKEATRRLAQAGSLLGIPLLDHLIFCENGSFYSFKEHGLLA